MKVVDPGHHYVLNLLDYDEKAYNKYDTPNDLVFVKREGHKYPGNVGHYPGTTLQEVLRACCDRLRYVGEQGRQLAQEQCPLNEAALCHLQAALRLLEVRAAQRHGRDSSKITADEAEFGKCCSKCNHVGCTGGCHET